MYHLKCDYKNEWLFFTPQLIFRGWIYHFILLKIYVGLVFYINLILVSWFLRPFKNCSQGIGPFSSFLLLRSWIYIYLFIYPKRRYRFAFRGLLIFRHAHIRTRKIHGFNTKKVFVVPTNLSNPFASSAYYSSTHRQKWFSLTVFPRYDVGVVRGHHLQNGRLQGAVRRRVGQLHALIHRLMIRSPPRLNRVHRPRSWRALVGSSGPSDETHDVVEVLEDRLRVVFGSSRHRKRTRPRHRFRALFFFFFFFFFL